MAKAKILFLTHLFPYPLNNGGYIRTYNLLRYLGQRYDLDFISFLYKPENINQIEFLKPFCRDIKVIPLKRKRIFPYFLSSLIKSKPYMYLRDYSQDMATIIDRKMINNNYDIIFEEQLWISGYIRDTNSSYRIYANQLIGEAIIDRFGTHQKDILIKILALIEARKLRKLERETCSNADMTLTISDEEKRIIESWGLPSEKITTVPMGVDTDKFKPLNLNYNSNNIINLGLARWPPNVDGILHFYNDIYPRVRKACPDAHLFIVGSDPPSKIRELGRDDGVTVTGFVEDLDSFLVNTGAFILPLRVGGGVKVRMLNALAMGLPVVSTTLGAEGIAVSHGKDVLLADSPDDFADAVIEVLTNPNQKLSLCKNGPLLVKKKYTWDAIYARLDHVFEKVETSIASRQARIGSDTIK
jgi:glycosyltransferase involved in cell wall biosynthesis